MKKFPVKSYNGFEYLDSVFSFTSNNGKIELEYKSGDIYIKVEEEFPFVALVKIRLQLEERGIKILCYGSRLDVYPSGAALGSLKAYELELGKPATKDRLRNIFDETNDINKIATVSEQELYWNKWLEISQQNWRKSE